MGAVAAAARKFQRPKRRKPILEYQTIGGNPLPKEEGQKLVLIASERLRQREEELAQQRDKVMSAPPPEPSPLARALQSLIDDFERKIVNAVWTERCLPGGGSGGQCGLSYFHDKTEIFANAVHEGGWKQKEYGAPEPKAIDAMPVALSWLSLLDRSQADLVHAAAGSKRGDSSANVSWGEVKTRLPEFKEFPVRTLQRRYEEGLEAIAMKVTFG